MEDFLESQGFDFDNSSEEIANNLEVAQLGNGW